MDGLARFLSGAAAAHGSRPALVRGREIITYDELDRLSRRAAGGLARLGIGRGDRVAFWLPNVPAYLVLFFACARLGAVAVAVNTRFRAVEVADIVGRSGARLLILWPAFLDIPFVDILAEVDPAALARIETVVLYGEPGDRPVGALPLAARTVTYERLVAGDALAEDRGGRELGCAIFTTSGTTKAPKFVLHAQRSVIDHARDAARSFGYDAPDAVLLQALPLCGVFGFTQALAGLAGGAALHMQPVFEAGAAARIIREARVTQLNGSDDMFGRLFDAAGGAAPFPSLRFGGFAAFSQTPAETMALAERHGLRLVGLYGMSEVQALFARWSEDLPAAERTDGGGLPVSRTAAARVRDPESGVLLAPGQSGELELRGPSLMAGYFENPEATAAAFAEDGFFRTGDLGYLRAGGGFVFQTRMGDVLRLGGFLVSPAEIEARLQSHPSVEVAQVVGVQTAGGPRAVAFVTAAAGAAIDEEALRAYCRHGLAGYKVPVRVVRLDAFPTTPSANGSKIQRARLRAMAQALDAAGAGP
ncbi:MAG TPA: AMP-binding protein [Candidatus Sulfotelmatobacter sp.]|nr:AMP-binding protein [Candidatus Sulfotelmatobacter sp.]